MPTGFAQDDKSKVDPRLREDDEMLWTLSPGINPGLKALKASHTKMLQGDRFRLHDCLPGHSAGVSFFHLRW